MDGFVFLDKNVGFTSTSCGNRLKGIFHRKKIGHVGTLDPFATGLLIIGVNKGTKAITFFDDFTKEYVATIKLGVATDSMDLTGKEIDRKPVPSLSKDKVKEVLNSFLGKSKQLPPMTSAIHVDGQKLYKLAHQGKEVERPLRDIEVLEIELLELKEDEVIFRAVVSKGTYIRVLGSDIANKLGTVGHLSALRRTKVGPFDVKDAVKMEDVSEKSLKSTYEVLKEFAEAQGTAFAPHHVAAESRIAISKKLACSFRKTYTCAALKKCLNMTYISHGVSTSVTERIVERITPSSL